MRIASMFSGKAKLWVDGRKHWRTRLAEWRQKNDDSVYWFHCASLGEFEQGRPLIEAIRKERQGIKIVLTFFSPSGFEMRKHYDGADLIMYLPLDTPGNADFFLKRLKPDKVFFVKYEYWANYFFACSKYKIPLYIVSCILRPDQRFFGTFKKFWQAVLRCVTVFFVQNDETEKLLRKNQFQNIILTGDTRYDRVSAISKNAANIQLIAEFVEGQVCIVGGSTWEPDEEILHQLWQRMKGELKLILVPHELTSQHIANLQKKWPDAALWSRLNGSISDETTVLILDTMGMLSTVYRYASLAYVGGGFGAGIHNTLEAAVWGIPVVFGPKFQKFQEAKELLQVKAAVTATNSGELVELMAEMGSAASALVKKNLGATELILKEI
jgi:3-deoxy-D-manno-octulosonic-acid transferase